MAQEIKAQIREFAGFALRIAHEGHVMKSARLALTLWVESLSVFSS